MGSQLSVLEAETLEMPLNNSLMVGFENRLKKDGSEKLALNCIPRTKPFVYYGLK